MSKLEKKHGLADKAILELELDALDVICLEYALRDAIDKEREFVSFVGISTSELDRLEYLLSFVVQFSRYWK